MRWTALVLAAALVACGGDSTGPKTPSVEGSWHYAMTNLTGGGFSCNSSGTTLTFTQDGTTFSGSYAGGTITCFDGTDTYSGDFGSGAVVTGTLSGQTVAYDFDTSDWHNSGTVEGTSMNGTVTMRISDPSGSTTILHGTWAAAKQ
jgi:hypothetical protein